jgi:YidC/Oxa1 family membrane protein insertase
VFSLLASVLAFFYDLIPNYAVAIVLLTLTVMLVLTPITLKGTRSMLAMQKLQPEMKKIQELHKGDRQAQNEAMMAFYKEHKINPLSGCLPMLLQFPVLIVMFRVLRGLVKTHSVAMKEGASCVGRVTTATVKHVTKQQCVTGKPSYLGHETALYKALQASGGRMKSFGVDFGSLPSHAGRGAPVLYVLIVLVVLSSFYQLRQMQSRTVANQANNQMNQQMQTVNRIMPLFSGLISLNLPGGVTLYFLISNVFRIAQQGLMYRFDPHLKAHMEDLREVKSRGVQDASPPAERKSLFSGLMGGAGGDTNGKTTNGKNGPRGQAPPSKPVSGRVTQPGRPGNAPRKRSKRKR